MHNGIPVKFGKPSKRKGPYFPLLLVIIISLLILIVGGYYVYYNFLSTGIPAL